MHPVLCRLARDDVGDALAHLEDVKVGRQTQRGQRGARELQRAAARAGDLRFDGSTRYFLRRNPADVRGSHSGALRQASGTSKALSSSDAGRLAGERISPDVRSRIWPAHPCAEPVEGAARLQQRLHAGDRHLQAHGAEPLVRGIEQVRRYDLQQRRDRQLQSVGNETGVARHRRQALGVGAGARLASAEMSRCRHCVPQGIIGLRAGRGSMLGSDGGQRHASLCCAGLAASVRRRAAALTRAGGRASCRRVPLRLLAACPLRSPLRAHASARMLECAEPRAQRRRQAAMEGPARHRRIRLAALGRRALRRVEAKHGRARLLGQVRRTARRWQRLVEVWKRRTGET
jgi:hypothetical protein